MVRRLVSWLGMLEMYPKLAIKVGEELDTYIQLIRALPTSIETAKQAGISPKVILSQNEFQASIDLYAAQGEQSVRFLRFASIAGATDPFQPEVTGEHSSQ
jgi:hypothetical protein